ncbi:type I pullulanase [Floccifex sp.]|uniref:type I pullulanase n=1 Tax=Floccifex sp. TaxID=2815810 RepID=UPI003EFF9667
MRKQKAYEAYIDDYESIIVYMKKDFYNGRSSFFYLKDQEDRIISLNIRYKENIDGYTRFRLDIEKNLIIGNEYYVTNEYGRSVICEYGHIVKTPKFYEDYFYPGKDLGLTYTKEKSTFKLWAPTSLRVQMRLIKNNKERIIDLYREEKGVFSCEIQEDLLGAHYTFIVRNNGTLKEVSDPYSSFSGPNLKYSMVEDIKNLSLPEIIKMEPLKSYCDAIIYECNIRDMTSQKRIGVLHPKTFYGFVEENEITKKKCTGFSYLKSLGITHIQLMPVFHFGSVNELHPELNYNWGYDPMHYRVLQGSYAMDPNVCQERILEFAYLVQTCHKAGIKVNIDVVYNHIYVKEDSILDQIVPNYYFLMDREGKLSNGSFCGNDIDMVAPMCKKYFLETIERIINWFDIDGLRFDLMGVLDCKFMNEVEALCHSMKPDFMVYGEGWNMPSFVPEYLRASQNNQDKMDRIAHFSDRFREVFKGSNGELDKRGIIEGRLDEFNNARNCLTASCLDYFFDSPEKVINYVECHDNHTLWDKLKICCFNESEETLKKRQIIANAFCLLAQGIPFLHSGQEYCRTKKGIDNSYSKSDPYNLIDYNLRNKNMDVVNATKELIRIRKEHPCFRLTTRKECQENVYISPILSDVIVYNTRKNLDHCIVFFNPSIKSHEYNLDRNAQVIFDSEFVNESKTTHVQIPPLSVVICSFEY